jgi:two-component system, sensor histidine kinase and response regulator
MSAIQPRLGEEMTMEQPDSARAVGEPSYRQFADHSPDWEYWLGPDGIYRYVSPACRTICGHAPE